MIVDPRIYKPNVRDTVVVEDRSACFTLRKQTCEDRRPPGCPLYGRLECHSPNCHNFPFFANVTPLESAYAITNQCILFAVQLPLMLATRSITIIDSGNTPRGPVRDLQAAYSAKNVPAKSGMAPTKPFVISVLRTMLCAFLLSSPTWAKRPPSSY